MGGIGLGPMGGLGCWCSFSCSSSRRAVHPATLGMILAVITALSLMQAAGGLDYVIELAEKILRRNPRRITISPVDHLCFDHGFRHTACDLCLASGDR